MLGLRLAWKALLERASKSHKMEDCGSLKAPEHVQVINHSSQPGPMAEGRQAP